MSAGIIVPDMSARVLLNELLVQPHASYGLFVNNIVPTSLTVLGDLVEADWPDYARIPVTVWSDAATSMGLAFSTADPVVWIRGAGGSPRTVYGYFVVFGSPGLLAWCENWQPGPIPMMAPTDQAPLTPRFTLRQDPVPG
jgi:hypothetical protein